MALEEGDIVLVPLPQADGALKNRPVLLLRKFPPYNDFLVCGISSQVNQAVKGFDYLLDSKDPAFGKTGLLQTSIIRLNFLAMVPTTKIPGKIGAIENKIRLELLSRLTNHLLG